MRGFQYTSYLTYSFSKSADEMKQIIYQDGYLDIDFKEQNKMIKYTVDNERVVRLDILLYLFKINYVRITVAQMIQLCLKIVLKYKGLEQNKVSHNYLDLNRVLLQLDQKCKSISILPKKLHYEIHFTGYDCPFYEKEDYSNLKKDDYLAVKDIVLKILQYTNDYSKEEITKNSKFMEIINNLMNEIQISFDSFIKRVSIINQTYDNINNQNQRLKDLDTYFNDINFKRKNRIIFVHINLEYLQEKYLIQSENWYLYEHILHQTLPQIVKELLGSIMIYGIQIYHKQLQDQPFVSIQNQLQKNYGNMSDLDELIKQELKTVNEEFKFEFDLNQIKQEIEVILQKQLDFIQYFQNDYQFQLSQGLEKLTEQIKSVKKSIIIKVIKEVVQDYLQLKNSMLIDDLI